jgi:HSP20 family protein
MTLPVRRAPSPLSRWAPLHEFEDLYEQMGRLVQSTFGDTGETWMPAADVSETDEAYVLEIELPGVKREDIDVDVTGNEVVVSGEIKEREKVGLLRRRTRRTGSFEYRATLPGGLETDKVEATLEEGVLTVRVPKSDRSKRRKVKVTER